MLDKSETAEVTNGDDAPMVGGMLPFAPQRTAEMATFCGSTLRLESEGVDRCRLSPADQSRIK